MNSASKKRTVALVVHDFDPNLGQGRYCHEIVRRLESEFDFEIHSNTRVGGDFRNVSYHKVRASRRNVLTTITSFLIHSTYSLQRSCPDLIHAQGLTCWSCDIITAHICNGARRSHLSRANWRSRLFSNLIYPVEKAFYRQRKARSLIAISESVKQEIKKEYGWKKETTVIYHGTDCSRFRPSVDASERQSIQSRFRIPNDRWIWLFMGEAVKGLTEVIQQLINFPKAHLLVVSRSDPTPYTLLAESLGVLERITFHGYEPKPEEAFRAADLFIYPSVYDTFGMVVTEAMASAIPVLVGDTVGAAELIQHKFNGMKFSVSEPESIHHCLQHLEKCPNSSKKMGVFGRRTILEYSWDRCAKETMQVYECAFRGNANK